MLGHGAKLGHKKEQAIVALLTHRSIEEAARAIGISPNTLLRWLKDPDFDSAYREARRAAFSQSMARLEDASGAAATTMLKIMLDSNVPAGIRLRAAEVVLEQGAKFVEIEAVAARVAVLERAAGSVHRPPQPSPILTWPDKKALASPAVNAEPGGGE